MRIALLHPTYWPEVRRGSERLAHDLAAALARRAHEVTLITTHRGRRRSSSEDGFELIRGRRMPEVPGLTWYYDEHLTAVPATLRELLRGEFDLAHALYPTDGWAAHLAQRGGGPPFVLSVHGIVDRPYLVRRRRRLQMLREAASSARAVSALSVAAATALRRYALAEPVVLPGGVVGGDYAGPVRRPPSPRLLCPAALADPRKRGADLLAAFALVRERHGDAELVLGGEHDPLRLEPVPVGPLPGGVRAVALDQTAKLAAAYRSATVTVLPSVDEAFGLVLVESLAAGTPVVAARSGGCPEIVDDPRVGRLFEPGDPAAMARAIGEAIELAADPATSGACRAHAGAWEWSRVVERYEDVYERALG